MNVKLEKVNQLLDKYVLPWPVRFLSNRFVILCTIALLIPLVVYASNQVLVLLVNSYLNTMGVAVSSIVLLYATISEIHQKQIAEMQEQRAQEDHSHVVEMHALMQQSLEKQEEQIEELNRAISILTGKAYIPRKTGSKVNLRSLHPRGEARFKKYDTSKRISSGMRQNVMIEQVRKGGE